MTLRCIKIFDGLQRGFLNCCFKLVPKSSLIHPLCILFTERLHQRGTPNEPPPQEVQQRHPRHRQALRQGQRGPRSLRPARNPGEKENLRETPQQLR